MLSAGEAIIFSGDKGKTEPTSVSPERAGLLKSKNRLSDLGPGDPQSESGIRRPPQSEPRKGKQQQNAEDERRNWLLLAPGELQGTDKDKASFGVRDYNLNDLEKPDNGRDYTFKNLGKSPAQGQSQNPAKGNSDDAIAAGVGKREPRGLQNNLLGGSDQPGAHTAKELDFSGMFGPGSSAAGGNGEKLELTLSDVLNSGGQISARAREQQQTRREDFKQFLDAKPPSGSQAGSGNAINFSTDFSRRSSNPLLDKPADTSARNRDDRGFGPSGDLGRAPNRSSSPGLPEMGGARMSGFSSLPLPSLRPAEPTAAQRFWGTGTVDPPRRKF